MYYVLYTHFIYVALGMQPVSHKAGIVIPVLPIREFRKIKQIDKGQRA